MPNLMNRRKKKNKVLETVMHDQSDSDSSEYDFSSKLNSKYNVLPEELDKSQKASVSKEISEDCKSIRFGKFKELVFVLTLLTIKN